MQLNLTKTENFQVDATPIIEQIDEIRQSLTEIVNNQSDTADLLTQTQSIIPRITALETQVTTFISEDVASDENFNMRLTALDSQIRELERLIPAAAVDDPPKVIDVTPKFEFILGVDADGIHSDDAWEEIIKKGQEIQYDYWKAAEDKYNQIWKLFPGWHGSAMSPVIKIVCEEPEYHFKDTKRLPGRFCLSTSRRWSSCLRFYGTGTKVIRDIIAYGIATNGPIGLYVEGKTRVTTSKGEMVMKPFEQTIEDVIICAHNGTVPVYLSTDQDRFCMRGVKILQHQGALVGIKHGPPLRMTDYPFDAVQDNSESNIYLADPRFENLQLEGPHTNKRPQAAMLLSGNNIVITNLNLYGWMQGPYMHGGQNRLINGLTQHWGNTHDGRQYCERDEIVSYTVSYRSNTKDSDAFSGIAGNFKQWYLPKRSLVPSKGGWHEAGTYIL